MHDAQFELELEQRRGEVTRLKEALAPRRKAEAETLATLAETAARHEAATKAAEAERLRLERDLERLAATEARLKPGLGTLRAAWVRILEPLLLVSVLFLGLLSIGFAPQPGRTAREAGVALLLGGALAVAWRSMRGR